MSQQTDRPVLVGVDSSPAALAAARYAADEARARDLPLVLVHAFSTPWIDLPLTQDDLTGEDPRTKADTLLASAARQVREEHPDLTVRTELAEGSPAEVLVDRSATAELLVVAQRGDGGFAGLLAGSVAVHVAAHAHCPVVVMRGDPKPDAPIVVGLDGSTSARHALRYALDIAARRGVPVHAVSVWPAPLKDPAEAEGVLAGLLAEETAAHRDVVVRAQPVYDRSPAGGLITAAADAGLVVVGSRGRGGLRGILLGSVGRALIEHAPCPVVVVREDPAS